MKKTFVTAAVVGVLVAVAACGGSSPSSGGSSPSSGGSSPSSGGSSPSSGGSSPSSGGLLVATSADRDKFVGTWAGNYGCAGIAPIADKMTIQAGSGDLGLSIIIHVDFKNPDTVTGTLTSATEVNVPEQSMGGANGTAKLVLNGDKLDFSATGLGITCGGSDYTRAP
jgi:hypothetical protein